MSVLREGVSDGEMFPVDSARDRCHKNNNQSPSLNTYRTQDRRNIWTLCVYIQHTIEEFYDA
jgi:hypothetical protein